MGGTRPDEGGTGLSSLSELEGDWGGWEERRFVGCSPDALEERDLRGLLWHTVVKPSSDGRDVDGGWGATVEGGPTLRASASGQGVTGVSSMGVGRDRGDC